MTYDVTNFSEQVLDRSFQTPVLVDFWAEWCGPCKTLGPVLERLADENGKRWALAKLDTEQFPDVAAQYGVRGIPNVKLFVDGKVEAEFTGALPERAVRQWLEKVLPSEYRKLTEQAEALLASGNTEAAKELLEKVVEAEPANVPARVLLARIYVPTDPDRAAQLVEAIEEDSNLFLVVEGIRTIAELKRKARRADALPESGVKKKYLDAIEALGQLDFDSALHKFIEVLREDRYYDDDGPRKACIAIFKYLGENHNTTLKYRREFSSALY
jgi:putative thioredoxin